MYKRIHFCLNQNQLFPIRGKVLGISGINNFYPLIDKQNTILIEADYPAIDMQNLSYDNNVFDYVITDQILEHVQDPQKAIYEAHRVLKESGIAIITTCFMNYLHFCPIDYWRFSPDSLKYLCNHFSETLMSEGWGNRIAILLCFISDRFRFMHIPSTKLSFRRYIANYNEYHYPIVTWIIARK